MGSGYWSTPMVSKTCLAATKQLYAWLSLSVCLSVILSVCLSVSVMWHLFHNVTIIISSWNFQWQKCCPKWARSEVKGQHHRVHNPTELFPDRNSSLNSQMMMKWCIKLDVALERCPIVFQSHPSKFKVTQLSKLSNLTQIGRFRTVTPVWIQQWLWNDAQSLK